MPTIGLLQSNPSLLNCPDRVIFHGHLMRYATPKGPLTRPSGLGASSWPRWFYGWACGANA